MLRRSPRTNKPANTFPQFFQVAHQHNRSVVNQLHRTSNCLRNFNTSKSLAMPAEVVSYFDKDTSTAQYVVSCTETKKCAIIDSVLGYSLTDAATDTKQLDQICEYITKNNLEPQWILETHAHADHITGAAHLKNVYRNAQTGIGSSVVGVQKVFQKLYNLPWLKTDGSQFDRLFADHDHFHIGNLDVEVIHTPGHTPGDVCYYVQDDAVFVGDVTFMPDQGTARCDFPEGSAEALWDSIQKLLSLPSHVRMFTCHDYQPGGRPIEYQSTVADQRAQNIHVKEGTKREEFLKMRKERDATLSAPKLIIPAVQVNINAGYFPPPEDNGITYLKVPVNVFKSTGASPGVYAHPQN